MKSRLNLSATLVACVLAMTSGLSFAQDVKALSYDYDTSLRTPVPIPYTERSLQTVTASPWFSVPGGGRVLEGAVLEDSGSLIFSDVTGRRVLRLSPKKELSVVTTLKDLVPAGLAIGPDNRIYIAAMDMAKDIGAIFSVAADGKNLKTVLPKDAGYMPDDLVFDKQGNFYFADFKGLSTVGSGGVFYYDLKKQKITSILPNLAKANGIALSQDGKTLWVTEYARNKLHRVELSDPTHIQPVGSTTALYFTGPAPDSMRIDADGNLYVAMHRQGRFMVLNPVGIPIGQILIPGRDEGKLLKSTSMAISTKTNECFIVAGDGDTGKESGVFRTKTFTHGIR